MFSHGILKQSDAWQQSEYSALEESKLAREIPSKGPVLDNEEADQAVVFAVGFKEN